MPTSLDQIHGNALVSRNGLLSHLSKADRFETGIYQLK